MSQVTLEYPRFLAAVALLWLPRGLLRVGPSVWRRRHRSAAHSWTHAPQDGTVLSAGHEFVKPRNYIDLARGAAGTLALAGGYGIAPAFQVPDGGGISPLLVLLAVIVVAVAAQTIRRERRGLSLNAPVFFVAGVMLALPPALPGLCAFALAWALVPIMPNTQGFMSVQTVVFVALAIFLAGLAPLTIAAAVGCFLPVFLSLTLRRPLMILSPRARSSRS
jgi:hypothetical protein